MSVLNSFDPQRLKRGSWRSPLPARDDVEALLELGQQRRDLRRIVLAVAVHRDHGRAAALVQPRAQCRRLAEVAPQGDQARARALARQALEDLARAVGRAVVDEHDLEAAAGGRAGGLDLVEQRHERVALVVDGHDDRDPDRAGGAARGRARARSEGGSTTTCRQYIRGFAPRMRGHGARGRGLTCPACARGPPPRASSVRRPTTSPSTIARAASSGACSGAFAPGCWRCWSRSRPNACSTPAAAKGRCPRGWPDALPGGRISGVDGRPEAVEAYRARNPGLDARVGDLAALPFEDGAFDLVLSTEVLEHLPDPRVVLRELGRVCAGHLFLTVPARAVLPRGQPRPRPLCVAAGIHPRPRVDVGKAEFGAHGRLRGGGGALGVALPVAGRARPSPWSLAGSWPSRRCGRRPPSWRPRQVRTVRARG